MGGDTFGDVDVGEAYCALFHAGMDMGINFMILLLVMALTDAQNE